MDEEAWRHTAAYLQAWGVGRRGLSDPLFDEPPPRRLGVVDVDDEQLYHTPALATCSAPGCSFAAADEREQAAHYESAHRYACAVCRRTLPSPRLLDMHLQETHDSFFAVLATRKPSYCCYTEKCEERFWNATDRFEHCVQTHKLPKDFRLERNAKNLYKNKPKKGRVIPPGDSNGTKTDVETQTHSEKETEKLESGSTKAFKTRQNNPLLPKQISFGQNSSKGFATPARKLTTTKNTQGHVDMDCIINELKDSLPE